MTGLQLRSIADAYALQRQWREATRYYQQAIAAGEQDSSLYGNLGLARLELGELAAAEEALVRATSNGSTSPRALFNLGLLRSAQHRGSEARQAYERAIEHEPDYFEAWVNLGNVLLTLREPAAAREAFRHATRLHPEDPVPEFLLAALEGRPCERAPAEHVRRLFDQYAPNFDHHLRDLLDYQTPERLLRFLGKRIPEDTRFEAMLDIGCGTGLAGEMFRDLAAHRTGVDISGGMIEQARRKGVYHLLEVADVVDYLRGSGRTYDLFVACDVLIYLGDLRPLFESMRRVARPGAVAVLSTEVPEDAAEGCEVHLGERVRFEHSPEHVRRAAAAAGWELVGQEEVDLRLDGGRAVPGNLHMIRLPA